MSRIKNWAGIAILLGLSINLVSAIVNKQAYAAEDDEYPPSQESIENGTFSFTRRDTITATINGKQYQFVDSSPLDAFLQYVLVPGQSICDGRINFDGVDVFGYGGLYYEFKSQGSHGQVAVLSEEARVDVDFGPSCDNTDPQPILKTITNARAVNDWFYWYNQDSIILVGSSTSNTNQFIREEPGSSVFKQAVDTCADKLIIRSPTTANIYRFDDEGGNPEDYLTDEDMDLLKPGKCELYSTVAWSGRGRDNMDAYEQELYGIIDADNSSTADPKTKPLSSVNGNIPPDCYSGMKGSLGWLICPVLGMIDNFIEWAERAIEEQLMVDLGNDESKESLRSTWLVIARLASGILVAIALVMVIATALGSDMVSPYALKKVLPRLVIGAMGIWTSWALVTTYIGIMNDLGRGISSIMLAPFQDAKEFSLQNIAGIASGDTGGGGRSGSLLVAIAALSLTGVSAFGLLGVGITALFAFLVAIFVLALRQAVIVFLVVLAPLGFAMWILPNTQKAWKLWSGTLNKLLIMYPMIMGLLTAGKIFSWITSITAAEDGGADKFLAFSIALIAYVAPYFFLPALFKAAGGAFSNLTGMVNDKSKGLFDKSRGWLDKKKALSNRELAKKSRDNLRTQRRTQEFAAGLAGGRLGAIRRRRAGGLLSSAKTRNALWSTATATARTTTEKELETTVAGDSEVLKVIALGGEAKYIEAEKNAARARGAIYDSAKTRQTIARAKKLAGAHLGDRNSQSAALLRLAAGGQAGVEHFEAVASALKNNPASASTVIGAAASASSKAGNISAGVLQYNHSTKKVGYKSTPDGSRELTLEEAVREKISTMGNADFANLRTGPDSATGGMKFSDSVVDALLSTDAGLARKIFEDKNVQLSGNARDVLLSKHGGSASGWVDPRTTYS